MNDIVVYDPMTALFVQSIISDPAGAGVSLIIVLMLMVWFVRNFNLIEKWLKKEITIKEIFSSKRGKQ